MTVAQFALSTMRAGAGGLFLCVCVCGGGGWLLVVSGGVVPNLQRRKASSVNIYVQFAYLYGIQTTGTGSLRSTFPRTTMSPTTAGSRVSAATSVL